MPEGAIISNQITRADLARDVGEWLGRTDITQEPAFTSLVRIAEANINRMVRPREREAYMDLSAASQYVDLPADLLRVRSLTLKDNNDDLLFYYTPEFIRESPAWTNDGPITAYTVEGMKLVLAPAPDADNPVTLSMTYVQTYPHLEDDTSSNWLLNNYYDVYLYGILQAAAIRLEDRALSEVYTMAFRDSINAVNESEGRARFPTSAALRTPLPDYRVV